MNNVSFNFIQILPEIRCNSFVMKFFLIGIITPEFINAMDFNAIIYFIICVIFLIKFVSNCGKNIYLFYSL